MHSKQKRYEELRRKISDILLRDWDPIGVEGVEEAHDEYDGWSRKILQLIVDGADANKIAHHLAKLESGVLATDVNPKKLIPVAEKLLGIDC